MSTSSGCRIWSLNLKRATLVEHVDQIVDSSGVIIIAISGIVSYRCSQTPHPLAPSNDEVIVHYLSVLVVGSGRQASRLAPTEYRSILLTQAVSSPQPYRESHLVDALIPEAVPLIPLPPTMTR